MDDRSLAGWLARAARRFRAADLGSEAGDLVAARIAEAAARGKFDDAVRLVQLRSPDLPGWVFDDEYFLHGSDTYLDLAFAVALADQIDYFLAQVEGGPQPGRGLALAARDDLPALAVLADWLEEQGRPVWAAEARHHAARLRPPP